MGSRDWWGEGEHDQAGNGEYGGERQYYNGVPPDLPLRPIARGAAPCFSEPLPINPPRPNVPYSNGFPVSCFGPDPCAAEFQLTDPTAALNWQNFANIICLIRVNGPMAEAALRQLFPNIIALDLFWNNPADYPPWHIVAVTPCQTIVVSQGTFTAIQLATELLYGAIDPINIGPFSTMPLWWRAAQYLSDKIRELGGENKPLFFAGHSYGAAAGAVLAAVIKWHRPDRRVRMITYGMPRVGDSRVIPYLAGVEATHLQTPGDPVPQLPPNPLNEYGLLSILGTTLFERWARLQTPLRTFVLQADGSAVQTDVPALSDALIQSYANTIAAGNPLGFINDHFITTYINYLYAFTPPLDTCRGVSALARMLAAPERCC